MKAITREWVDKAEGDWASLGRETRARKSPNYDAACFHAQQCAEKYLKARLVEASTSFPKTHDLSELLRLLLPIEPSWGVRQNSADVLKLYGVEFRYPGKSADRDEARDARNHGDIIRRTVRTSLGFSV